MQQEVDRAGVSDARDGEARVGYAPPAEADREGTVHVYAVTGPLCTQRDPHGARFSPKGELAYGVQCNYVALARDLAEVHGLCQGEVALGVGPGVHDPASELRVAAGDAAADRSHVHAEASSDHRRALDGKAPLHLGGRPDGDVVLTEQDLRDPVLDL